MAKNKLKAMPDQPTMLEMPTRIHVNKAQAGKVSVGDTVSVTVKGEVSGIHENYGGKDQFEIELKKSSVSEISDSSNSADKEFKKMKSQE